MTIQPLEQIEAIIDNHNGKKTGKKNRLPNSAEARRLDAQTNFPAGWNIKKGKSPSRIEICYSSKTFLYPRGHGNTLRVANTGNNGRLTAVGPRAVIWYLCEMKCQSNQKEGFQFGVYRDVETDHSISRKTLYTWLLKGIIDKTQLQYLGNCVLMRKSKNASKGDRSEYSRLDKYFTKEETDKVKKELDHWFKSTDIGDLWVERKDGKGLARATNYAKLALWYKVHEMLETPFYRKNRGDLLADFPFDMISKYHQEEAARIV